MTYTPEFFTLEGEVAGRSAEIVIPWVLERTGARSVIDVGCGVGAWLQVAKSYDCEVFGVDGHVPETHLLLEPDEFWRMDLTGGFPCEGYDLALCLEVAEHLPEEAAGPLVEGLAEAEFVLFSAATPGQVGVGHINCQEHGYWHSLFAGHGFEPDPVGVLFDEPVADFYRRNLFLYR